MNWDVEEENRYRFDTFLQSFKKSVDKSLRA